ncbi:arylsulfatase [Paenibacillus rigui]|uniref:Arylsulfatase n=2 Tax=Paenibacillus rigui TaxID=554312 RepID=A0A229UHW7_9BACL|nr:arylsulfatase [Paenibacillus rigui]
MRSPFRRRPNILLVLVDEERYPPVYETSALRAWRQKHLLAHEWLRHNGMEFHRHYTGSVACCPSRATLLTGQYPSLHGVTQTSFPGKDAASPDIYWLDPNTVPTLGDYFRAGGYQTYYYGKWHVSHADIGIPGTHDAFPSYDPSTGFPDQNKESIYIHADRLEAYGFHGWVGPEPHGVKPHNSGSSAAIGLAGRDQIYAAEAAAQIESLDRQYKRAPGEDFPPWLIVCSFVNPHDIALFGEISRRSPLFRFEVERTVPDIPPPPTLSETLLAKPRCQRSYREIYPLAFQPTANTTFYRQLYYQLQKNVDRQMLQVLHRLQASSFYEDTIVVFTSDHGELLGAHGGLHQKWYCAYEENIRVPLIIHNPKLFPSPASAELPTSHVDLLPTLLGLAGIDQVQARMRLKTDHTEVHPLVGRDLSPLMLDQDTVVREEPIYFMTDDDPTRNESQVGIWGMPYQPVVQPNRIETVIARLSADGKRALWKYSRYFERLEPRPHPNDPKVTDEYELYNLSEDASERVNLARPELATEASRQAQAELAVLLEEQRRRKRLMPSTQNTPRGI